MPFTPSARRAFNEFEKEFFGILFLGLGVFLALCLLSYDPLDPSLNTAGSSPGIHNLGGPVGAYLGDLLFSLLGITAYFVAALFFLVATLKFMGRTLKLRLSEALYYFLFILFLSVLLHLQLGEVAITGHLFPAGGLIGSLLGQFLIHYLSSPGTYVLTLTGLCLSFVLATHLRISAMAINGWRVAKYSYEKMSQWMIVSYERLKKAIQKRPLLSRSQRTVVRAPQIHAGQAVRPDGKGETKEGSAGAIALGPKIFERADTTKKPSGEDQLKFLKIGLQGYQLPPLSLLDAGGEAPKPVDEESLKKNAQLLEKKLLDYEVEGRVTEIHPGPVITMYEFEPAPGTKVNKIVGLETDLSLTMGGRSIRIVPHLPGKAALGIEIPNHEREIAWLRDVISSDGFAKSKSKLTLCLGKDTEGRPFVTDLTRMPHLLVAGATGTGKSVAIHAMIMSALYKSSPEEVRFILIDPKMLELTAYEGIPHLLLPVVTNIRQAVIALRWCIREMEKRYRLLADAGARNISGYNHKVENKEIQVISEEEAGEKLGQDKNAICHTGKLSYLVIIIDELADLMMMATQEMESTITRLAQMARASGIHLILATQRPSVDVITGLIKANFPARISFKVSSKHDSRTIIDQIGAETLLGAGDMLYLPPNESNLLRIHGSYVTEEEIRRIVGFLKEQGGPTYDTSILQAPDEILEVQATDEIDDELYDMAVRLVTETRQASISMIQRRLRVGYNRAARLIERMESQGVVGPQEGIKPRQVLANPIEGARG